ncbi:MAG: methyltransferase domain-containing protein [Coriobacteriia bacterium]|nr:methyltransferase domain-containing protein [Coriobacteriia bacterium]
MTDIREQVKEYYSKITVENGGEMVTHTCSCGSDCYPEYIREILPLIPDEVSDKFYGCGSPLPLALEGCTVLDLGCGTGRDVYVAAKLVRPEGKVIGVDMNPDQLAVANKYKDEMAQKYGYSNVEFIQGYIEDLSQIPDDSVDVVISNCVISLSPNKEAVFSEIYRILKFGGELYFSDIFADRRIPEPLNSNPLLRGECLGGAMYIEDFRRLMTKVGWQDFRYMSSKAATIDNPEVEAIIGNIQFTSRTIRAFKLPGLQEDICEQYGQTAIYRGGILGSPNYFDLDDHHRFFKDLRLDVCGNSCAYVQNTRFGKYFEVFGDRSIHFGPYEGCGNAPSVDGDGGGCCGGGCC